MQELLGSYSHLEEELVIHISQVSTEIISKFIFKSVLSNIVAFYLISH